MTIKNLDQSFSPKTFSEIHPSLSDDDLKEIIGETIKDFLTMSMITKSTLAFDLGTTVATIDNWIKGMSMPDMNAQKSLRRYIHSIRMYRLKRYVELPDCENSKIIDEIFYSVISALDEMYPDHAIRRAKAFSHDEIRERFNDVKNIDDYFARNYYLWAVALLFILEETGESDLTEVTNLLKKAKHLKPASNRLRYSIELQLLNIPYQDSEIDQQQAKILWLKLFEIHQIAPECSLALWNMARCASLAKNEEMCKKTWGMLKSHKMRLSYKAKSTLNRKKDRIFETPNMEFFIKTCINQ